MIKAALLTAALMGHTSVPVKMAPAPKPPVRAVVVKATPPLPEVVNCVMVLPDKVPIKKK